ncbi:chromosome condensation complex Condensin, subunit G [Marasmius sp. AFHP31]|nr:chromosome condensation complex Condensin, subunit G [Marasmius sp. AFHP31]
MVWPQNLIAHTLLNMLHAEDEEEGKALDTRQQSTATLRKERSLERIKEHQADLTELRRLTLCIGMLERVDESFEDNSTLEGGLTGLIILVVKEKHGVPTNQRKQFLEDDNQQDDAFFWEPTHVHGPGRSVRSVASVEASKVEGTLKRSPSKSKKLTEMGPPLIVPRNQVQCASFDLAGLRTPSTFLFVDKTSVSKYSKVLTIVNAGTSKIHHEWGLADRRSRESYDLRPSVNHSLIGSEYKVLLAYIPHKLLARSRGLVTPALIADQGGRKTVHGKTSVKANQNRLLKIDRAGADQVVKFDLELKRSSSRPKLGLYKTAFRSSESSTLLDNLHHLEHAQLDKYHESTKGTVGPYPTSKS